MENTIIRSERLKNLLKNLIDIYSPSGKEEQVQKYLYDYLKRRGLQVRWQALDENRYNLLVLPKDEDGAELVLVGHVDTVSAYDLDDFGFSQKDDRIWGLGAADMKGGCAAMIEAFDAAFHYLDREPPIGLALVVGEEEDGDGAARLLEDYHFPWAVIGEPTGLVPCLGHYGYMEIQLSTVGKRMHASLANRRENAVEVLLNGFIELSHYVEKDHPEIVYNLRDLYSARAGFAVSDRCEAWLDIHMPPAAPIGEIATKLEEIFSRHCETHNRIDGTFKIFTIASGYELPTRGPVIETLQEVFSKKQIPWKTDTFRSHSDANQLWAAGVKPILLGAGRLEMAHTPEESVSFQKVRKAAEVYADLIIEMVNP